MVDISKCSRRDCSKKNTCFRYLADADDYGQSYLVIDTVDLEDGCENYWQCRTARDLELMNKLNR